MLKRCLKNSTLQPIGIFDSGTGGLTVTKAVVDLLPHESIIYFGDTAHLPYGEKSASAIQSYTLKIAEMLLQRGCKMLLVACHSISAAAYEALQNYVADRALLVNVIEPVIEHLGCKYHNKTVGLIGTRQTVKSNIYNKKIVSLDANITFRSLATPLLVPIIEEGFFEHKLIDLVLAEYLSKDILRDIDALILGCTHYPIIKNSVINYYKQKVAIIDAATIVAEEVKQLLMQQELINDSAVVGTKHFYVSDYTDAFVACAKMFFGDNVCLEYYPLWDE